MTLIVDFNPQMQQNDLLVWTNALKGENVSYLLG